MYELSNDAFYALRDEYPACVVDYCLMKDDAPYRGEASHRAAIAFAMQALCAADEDEGPIWEFDASRGAAQKMTADALLSTLPSDALSYCRAFTAPPHGSGYTEKDFARLNAALFPQGTDGLTVFSWSTDWSDYFDDGHEWWGAACWSVYDAKTDRYAVIMASASD